MPALVLQLASCLLGGSTPAGWAQTMAPTRIQLGVRDMLEFNFSFRVWLQGGVLVHCGLQNGGWRTKRWRKLGGAGHQKCFHSASHHLAVLQNIFWMLWNLIWWNHLLKLNSTITFKSSTFIWTWLGALFNIWPGQKGENSKTCCKLSEHLHFTAAIQIFTPPCFLAKIL